LPGKLTFEVRPGDVLRIETPGGGGFGSPATTSRSLASPGAGVYRGTVPGDGDGGA
jgi:N-methylhydantoinase B/oxoprolinase/acetone carboxylase alpha subunit